MENLQPFETIREFSRRNIIPEGALRRLVRAGQVPGFYSGTKFLINSTVFLHTLENGDAFTRNGGCGNA